MKETRNDQQTSSEELPEVTSYPDGLPSQRKRGSTQTDTSALSRRRQTGIRSTKVKKVKEVDLYSAFIEVPYTQGAQVQITQCYLQITPYLPLPRKHSPDGASQTEVADI